MKGNRACWDGLTQVAFKQRAEGDEGSKLQIIWERSIVVRGNSRC